MNKILLVVGLSFSVITLCIFAGAVGFYFIGEVEWTWIFIVISLIPATLTAFLLHWRDSRLDKETRLSRHQIRAD